MIQISSDSLRRLYGKGKRLRASGKHLSDIDIAKSDYVLGEVRVYGMASVIIARVTDPNSHVGTLLLPILYRAQLITMSAHGMLFYGGERPHGDAGPAYIQERSFLAE